MFEVSFESTRYLTQQEFSRWVRRRPHGDLNHYELLHGRVVMNPPAGFPHGESENRVQVLVGQFVRARSLGRVFGSSQGFDLPSGDTVEPDTSYVSRERWEAAPPPAEGEFLRVVPDLVVEVLSRGNWSRDRGEKKGIYEQNGIREYWLLDPIGRSLTILSLQADGRYDLGNVYAEDQRAASRVLPGLEFPVSDLLP